MRKSKYVAHMIFGTKITNALKMFTAIFNFLNTAILAIPMLQTDFENC